MGNLFGKNEDYLNYNQFKKLEYSENIPYLTKIQNQSLNLASKLKENNKNFLESDNYNMYKLFQQNDNLSDTSVFLSSELYKNLSEGETSALNTEINNFLQQNGGTADIDTFTHKMFKKYNNLKQNGGSNIDTFITPEMFKKYNNKNLNNNNTSEIDTELNNYINNNITELTSTVNNNQKGGKMNDESSSSSKFMSDDKLSEDVSETIEQMIKKVNKFDDAIMDAMSDTPVDNMDTVTSVLGRNDDYVSSSAHTNGVSSNNKEEYDDNSYNSLSSSLNSSMNSYISSVSSLNKSNKSDKSDKSKKYLTESINTSDINMISVE